MLAKKLGNQRLVAGVADDERRTFRYRPVVTGGKVIEYDDGFSGIEQLEHHVAADKASSAGNEDRHGFKLAPTFPRREGAYPKLMKASLVVPLQAGGYSGERPMCRG